MKNYSVLNGMKDNQADVLNTAFDKGYKQGLEDGRLEITKEMYERGLRDAWDAAGEIACISSLDCDDLFTTHNLAFVFRHFSASEAIAKIKEYEEKQETDDDIKVGDEIKCVNEIGIATRINDDIIYVTIRTGYGCAWSKHRVEKTGRHFQEVAEVLAKMQEVEE